MGEGRGEGFLTLEVELVAPATSSAAFSGATNYSFTCTTFAGGNPLKYVADALPYAPIFSA